MNAVYRVVWNAASGQWVVASELAKGRKKKASRLGAIAVLLALGAGSAMAQSYNAGDI